MGDSGADVSELVRLIPFDGALLFRLGTRMRPGVDGERAMSGESGGSGGGGVGCVAARGCGCEPLRVRRGIEESLENRIEPFVETELL